MVEKQELVGVLYIGYEDSAVYPLDDTHQYPGSYRINDLIDENFHDKPVKITIELIPKPEKERGNYKFRTHYW